MYHIKPDKRSRSSAEEIVRGLQECLKFQPLKSVTVTDIHRVTGISRATFYRLFDTPEDVLIFKMEQMQQQVEAYYRGQPHLPPEKLLQEAVSISMYNHDFIHALVESGRFDLLYRYTEKNFRILDSICHLFLEKMGPLERDYVISHLSMNMVASLITWNRNGQKETPEDVVRYLKSYVQIASDILG